jgi:hypothetical protein
VDYVTKNTSAYMFDYDKLKDLMNIDFEREDISVSENPAEEVHTEWKEMKLERELPL